MVIALAQILLSGYNSMTKIMSVSLVVFLFCNNQLVCSEKSILQDIKDQQILITGHHGSWHNTLSRNAKIEITSCGSHNHVEVDVLSPSAEKIAIKLHECATYNNVIVHMPFSSKMPEVTCDIEFASNFNNVTIYSFGNVTTSCVDEGDHNNFRVISPLRRLIAPVAVVGGIGFIYWMVWGKS